MTYQKSTYAMPLRRGKVVETLRGYRTRKWGGGNVQVKKNNLASKNCRLKSNS
jgi:hypothetical protein